MGEYSPGSTRQRRLKATTFVELYSLTAVAIAVSSEGSRAARGWGAGGVLDATTGAAFDESRTWGAGDGANMVAVILERLTGVVEGGEGERAVALPHTFTTERN
jgi:hypothetical protein